MIRIIATGLALALVSSAAVATPIPEGVWATPGSKAQIRISSCGGSLCATLAGMRKPNDKAGRPKVDKYNPDKSKRGQPVMGMALTRGMAPSGQGWNGSVYNPDDGRTYVGTITVAGADKLTLRGCALKVFCKSQTLTRVR